MTEEELHKMTVEEIIRLPNFISLTNSDNQYPDFILRPKAEPHWEIRLRAERVNGKNIIFGRECVHTAYLIYKYKDK